jgi:hypothetical protein
MLLLCFFLQHGGQTEGTVTNPYFLHITVTVIEESVLEINFLVALGKKLGLGVYSIQITCVSCHIAVQ